MEENKASIEEVEYLIEPTGNKLLDLPELWQYRELFYFFTWRDVKVKYKQTVLGIIWVIIQPILTVVIFSFFFGNKLSDPSSDIPYPVFVFSGLLLWNMFSASVNTAGNSMLANATIIKKIYFPRIIIPISSMLVSAIDFLVAFMVFILALIYYQIHLNFLQLILCWPLAVLLTVFGTTGISCWLAALNVKYRDFRYLIPFALQIALFVSPVIYPVSVSGNKIINYILALNPMFAAITIFRIPLTNTPVDQTLIAISILSTLFFFIVGIYYFKKTEAYFADIA